MTPPKRMNVLDKHNGFTALVPTKQYVKKFATNDEHGFLGWESKMVESDTLWRPACVLRGKTPEGKLISFDEHSFYQSNRDVTEALYKVPGYRYKVVAWFDNKTNQRIA